ncbi:hypothetical protein BH18ACI5_BH18ACI5_11300 [soil metagenome]
MTIRTALLVVLVALSAVFITRWRRSAAARPARAATEAGPWPSFVQIAIGFVTDFFDTLGIGSFATTTTAYKLLHVVPDERLVGTMLIGHSLPVVVQAFIFLVVVQVDPVVLALLVGVSILGSWMGAGVASRLPRRPIQIGMGIGLFAAAFFMLMSQLGMFPGAGIALTLTSGKLLIALRSGHDAAFGTGGASRRPGGSDHMVELVWPAKRYLPGYVHGFEATRALQLLLPYARAEGLSSVDLTTGADDLASQRVIQANGGTVIERFFKPAAYGEAESLRFPPMRIVLSIAVVVLVIASNARGQKGTSPSPDSSSTGSGRHANTSALRIEGPSEF